MRSGPIAIMVFGLRQENLRLEISQSECAQSFSYIIMYNIAQGKKVDIWHDIIVENGTYCSGECQGIMIDCGILLCT